MHCRHLLHGLCAGLLLTVAVACSRPPLPASISFQTSPRAETPMRVAVLPFALSEGVGRSAQSFDTAFPAALRTLGRHEVIQVSPEKAKPLMPERTMSTSAIAVSDLLRMRDALQVDAVILGRIDQFAAFDPLAAGITVHLVSLDDGAVLWSATAHLDGARSDTQEDLKWWYGHGPGDGHASISGWKLAMTSPSVFSRYVSDRLVETLPMPTK